MNISQRVIYAMHRMNLPRMLKAGPENDLQKAIARVVEALERQSHPHIESACKDRAREALKELDLALKECGV